MNPLDELNVQLPGRLMVMEMMVTFLLKQTPNRQALLDAVEHLVDASEAVVHADNGHDRDLYTLAVFTAARETVDTLRKGILL